MSLTDDDKRWIEELINAKLQLAREPNPQNFQQFQTGRAGALMSRGTSYEPRGTSYEPSIHSEHCRHCGMTYDAHKGHPPGACQDARRQG